MAYPMPVVSGSLLEEAMKLADSAIFDSSLWNLTPHSRVINSKKRKKKKAGHPVTKVICLVPNVGST